MAATRVLDRSYTALEGHARLRTELGERRAERHRVVEIVSWAASNGNRGVNASYKDSG